MNSEFNLLSFDTVVHKILSDFIQDPENSLPERKTPLLQHFIENISREHLTSKDVRFSCIETKRQLWEFILQVEKSVSTKDKDDFICLIKQVIDLTSAEIAQEFCEDTAISNLRELLQSVISLSVYFVIISHLENNSKKEALCTLDLFKLDLEEKSYCKLEELTKEASKKNNISVDEEFDFKKFKSEVVKLVRTVLELTPKPFLMTKMKELLTAGKSNTETPMEYHSDEISNATGSMDNNEEASVKEKDAFIPIQDGYLAMAIMDHLKNDFWTSVHQKYKGATKPSVEKLKILTQNLFQSGDFSLSNNFEFTCNSRIENTISYINDKVLPDKNANGSKEERSKDSESTNMSSPNTADQELDNKNIHQDSPKKREFKMRSDSPGEVVEFSSSEETDASATVKRRRGRAKWSDKEIRVLVEAVKAHGKDWSYIAKRYRDQFNERSNVNIKDKYRWLLENELI